MGATKLLAQIFWVLVTDRAEILRDRLEERQDPSFWIKFQMMVRGVLSKIEFSANTWRWLAERDAFGWYVRGQNFARPKVVFRPSLHLENIISSKSRKNLYLI